MIYGIGSDIVEIARIRDGLKRHGRRFAERILTEEELAAYDATAKPAHFLAKRFAAKEAAVKAMGTGFRHGMSLKHITIGRDPLGKPTLVFDGVAADKVAEAGIISAHLSLADEREYAVAFVVMEVGRD